MSVRKLFAITSLVLVVSAATPSKASADWLFTPFVGWNWGGTANLVNGDDFDDEFEQKAMFGASLGWMGAGVIGFEADLGYSPNFFEQTAGSGNFEFGDSNLTTLHGQPDHRRSDRRTERARLPALRGWRRRHHQEPDRRRGRSLRGRLDELGLQRRRGRDVLLLRQRRTAWRRSLLQVAARR